MSHLAELCGHEDLQSRFRRAAVAGRLPQSLLLHGPDGIGKQRLALWIAALALCTADEDRRPCGVCPSCGMVGRLQHPDLHWFFPLTRPKKSTTPAKLRDAFEVARSEEIALRAQEPLRVPPDEDASAIYLAMVEELRARSVRRPAVGDYTVFVVGDADRMVPQAASQEAANAFLKLLEEPPADTLVILTSSRPGALLPTIRSRVLAVRATPPSPADAAAFLERVADVPAPVATRIARRAQGAVGLALRILEADEGDADDGWRLLSSAVSGPGERWAAAAALPVRGARGPFTRTLDRLELVLRECITATLGSVDSAWHVDSDDRVRALAPLAPDALISCLDHVETARRAAAGNGNPQAIAAVLLSDLARELRPGGPSYGNAAGVVGYGAR